MEEAERTVHFTNTYVTDAKTDRQMFRRIRRVPRLIVFLISGAVLGYLVYWLIRLIRESAAQGKPLFSDSSPWIFILGIVLIALMVVRELLAPGTFANRQAKRLQESYGSEHITIDAAFSDDAIDFQNHASNAEMHLPYTSLKLLSETKDLFLIRTQQKQLIALAKNGFSGTDAAGFRTFMDEKCPTAKRKWRKAE
jgi:hypothetical protein